MNPPVSIQLSIPANLKRGHRAGVFVTLRNTGDSAVHQSQVCLLTGAEDEPVICDFDTVAADASQGVSESANIRLVEAGDIFLKVFLRALFPGTAGGDGIVRVFRGHVPISITHTEQASETHFHLVGKQDNTQAEKQFAGAASSDDISITLNMPGQKQDEIHSNQGMINTVVVLGEVAGSRWPVKADTPSNDETGTQGQQETSSVATQMESLAPERAETDQTADPFPPAGSISGGPRYDDGHAAKSRPMPVMAMLGIAGALLAVVLVSVVAVKAFGTKPPVVNVNQVNSSTHDGKPGQPAAIPPTSPAPVSKGGAAIVAADDTAFSVILNKSAYREGDIQSVSVRVPEDGYLYVASIWADGKVYVYFPHAERPDARVHKGEMISLPPNGWKIEMFFPSGYPGKNATERVQAFLSPTPLEIMPAKGKPSEQTSTFLRLGLVSKPYLARYRGGRMRKEEVFTAPSKLKSAGAFYTITPD